MPNNEDTGAIQGKSKLISALSSVDSPHLEVLDQHEAQGVPQHPDTQLYHTQHNSYLTDSHSLTLPVTEDSHQRSIHFWNTYLSNHIENHRNQHSRVKRDKEATLPTSGAIEYEMDSPYLTRSDIAPAHAHWFAGQRRVRHGRKKFYNNGDRSGWGGGYG